MDDQVNTEAENPSIEINPKIIKRIELAEKAINGELAPNEEFDGLILDLNDSSLTIREVRFLSNWIEEKLGAKIEEAPIKERILSPDEKTSAVIYSTNLGDDWFISKWQNEGEKASFILNPQEAYDWKVEEDGYRQL